MNRPLATPDCLPTPKTALYVWVGLLGLMFAWSSTRAHADTLYSLSEDRNVHDDGFLGASSSWKLLPGGAGGSPAKNLAPVFVFRLPDFGNDPLPFADATFLFNIESDQGTPPDIDLYGLGRRSSADVVGSDYYGETTAVDPTDATLLEATILYAGKPSGLAQTSAAGSQALKDYLNAQYASGAGAGDYVFLRMSSTSTTDTARRFELTSADGAVSSPTDTRPRIVYGESPDLVERPFIWVRNSDKAALLDKIAHTPWATGAYNDLVARVGSQLTSHQTDRRNYLSGLPVEDWSVANPKMKTIPAYPEETVRYALQDKLNEALDCAILYYLTGDTNYASLAADVMHNTIQTLLAVTPSTSTDNGGWVFQDNYLKEVRVSAPQLPIIYDFLRDYLLQNQVYDYKNDAMVGFELSDAQQVFYTLYTLALNHGSRNSNWSALMSTTMLNSLLAIDNEVDRTAYLEVFLQTGSSNQASLDFDYRYYNNPGDIWPESLQYATDVGEIRTLQMVLLERIDPTLDLFTKYPNLPISIPRVPELRYPNGEVILFGDGPRNREEPYFTYELVYQHARARSLTDLQASFGAHIKDGMESGAYDRSRLKGYARLSMHTEPLHLLWSAPDVPESAQATVLPRTDELTHAGITLQRNTTEDPTYGLMSFVGGAGHIHSHASGMSMELYGLGHVLGPKSGASTYQTTFHENYSRVYASNNTVIVNGASRGEGGWQDIGINTVQTVAMEPAPKQNAVSPSFSFTSSSFEDNRGSRAEAGQQRTMGIVRTSPTTGFYVDIFRSNSSLPDEYHDYIYRNIGETEVDIRSGGSPVAMTIQPDRFQNDIGDEYQQPGWRYFTNTEVSPSISEGVTMQFVADMPDATRYMDMHMPAVTAREYAKVDSPPLAKSPSPYNSQDVPAMVIRQHGEAWAQAFAAVYEPHFGVDGNTIQSVDALTQGGVVRGVKVVSMVHGETVTNYVFTHPQETQTYTDAERGLSFTGRYGVIEHREGGRIKLYLGQGSSIEYQGNRLTTTNGNNSAAEADLVPYHAPRLTSNASVSLVTPPLTGYAAWASTHAPNNRTDADFDQDGVSNGVEYILGGNKFRTDQDKLPEIAREGTNMVFTFDRDQNSIDGNTLLQIEVGSIPDSLTEVYTVPETALNDPSGLSVIKDSSPGYDTIVLRIPTTGNLSKFARISVTP